MNSITQEPQLIELMPQPFLSIRTQVSPIRLGAVLEALYDRILDFISDHGLEPDGLPCVIFHDIKDYEVDVEAAIPITVKMEMEGEIRSGMLPGGLAILYSSRGSYRQVHEAYSYLSHWLVESGLTPRGPFWEVYSTETDESCTEEDCRTDIFWPIREPDSES